MDGLGSCHNPAPGGPGTTPKWTRGAKDGVVTAYSTSSTIWATLSRGLVNEVYYPTIDRPQLRDLQFLVTDGETFFHDERRNMNVRTEILDEHALGFRITTSDPEGRYKIVKDIITDPHEPTLLIHTRFEVEKAWRGKLQLFVLCAPHLDVGGQGNSAQVVVEAGRKMFVAYKDDIFLALAASLPFKACSCGYVGENDGWQDLSENFTLDFSYDCVQDGNIALTGEIDLSGGDSFTLALSFGHTLHNVVTTLLQSLSLPFEDHKDDFVRQWERSCAHLPELEAVAGDDGTLYHRSYSLLLAHEDKTYPGAMVASLSIPWGQAKGDEAGEGGYHLVWTRDLVQSVMGLLAIGNTSTPLRGLIYIAVAQLEDGGFHQNFWVDGDPYWTGVQLDEVAFPILLAWRLHTLDALQNFDPYPMVLKAAAYLVRHGPATPQERWEENSGYSPSTLAVNIAALTCAAHFARDRGDAKTASFFQTYADFLNCHVETWTVTSAGTLHPDIAEHYIRITPAEPGSPHPNENPNEGVVNIANRPPGTQVAFPAKDIVDAGFLELVRYGVRAAGSELMENSLKVIDKVLKLEAPQGDAWHRYNHDGYGQRPDGGPYEGWGEGRAWPLLGGERGHYELAAGRDVKPFIKAFERFANDGRLLPEQVWDEADRPEQFLFLGEPTGSAMPLMWAHAEYLKLLRSAADGAVFDRIAEVYERYVDKLECQNTEIWKPNRQPTTVKRGYRLRVQCPKAFRLRWSLNDWEDAEDTRSEETAVGLEYVDLDLAEDQQGSVRFTFYWLDEEKWEGQDYEVKVIDEAA